MDVSSSKWSNHNWAFKNSEWWISRISFLTQQLALRPLTFTATETKGSLIKHSAAITLLLWTISKTFWSKAIHLLALQPIKYQHHQTCGRLLKMRIGSNRLEIRMHCFNLGGKLMSGFFLSYWQLFYSTATVLQKVHASAQKSLCNWFSSALSSLSRLDILGIHPTFDP